jgi:uncharacterized membrane protein
MGMELERQQIAMARKYDVTTLFILSSGFFLTLKIHQFVSFGIGFELADFELVLWNTLHGRFLQMSCTHLSFFSEHFSPVLLLILPVYALFQSPYTLLVLQALACSAAVIPLYFLVSEFTTHRWPPVAFCLAFTLSRVVNYGLMYDFHPEILYPVIFFSLFLALEKKRWVLFYILVALASMVKEDAFIALFGLGGFVFFGGHKKHGIITSIASVIGLVLVMLVIIPYFREQAPASDYKFISYWSGYGSTQKEIIMNFFNPLKHIEVIFTPAKLKQMFNLFSVFLFLPFLSWRTVLFLVLPNWFMLYSSDNGLMNGPIIYYGLLITPFLFYASLVGIAVVARKWNNRANMIMLGLASLVLVVQLGNSRVFKQLFQDQWTIPERYRTTVHDIIRTIPANSSIAAQVHLGPHVPIHPCRTCFPFALEKVDFVFLDLQGNRWPFSESEYDAYIDSLRHSGEWETVSEIDGFLLLKRAR